jgi:hypothetical protein
MEKITTTEEIGHASDLVNLTWQIHQDHPPSSKETSTWSWTTNASSTVTPNIYHEGVRAAEACPWSTLRFQEDLEQHDQNGDALRQL